MATRSTTNTKTAAQQAELDKMRAAKAHAQTVQSAPVAAPDEDMDTTSERFQEYINEMLAQIPSGRRAIAAFATSMLLSIGAGWMIGIVVSTICTVFSFGFILSFLTLLLGAVVAFYAGMKIGQHVGGYILSGQIDKDAVAAKDKVVGWFSSAKSLVTKKPVTVAA